MSRYLLTTNSGGQEVQAQHAAGIWWGLSCGTTTQKKAKGEEEGREEEGEEGYGEGRGRDR